MNELEAIRTEPGWIQRALEGGPIIMGALVVLVISAVLFLAWVFLALRRRRASPRLLGVALSLAVFGYLAYDWQYILLNLAMRNPQEVRQECVRLLQHQNATVADEYRELHLHGSEIPASFTRLGAKFVRVTRGNVQISLIPESPLTGGAWGFLYAPERANSAAGWPDYIRPAWYRDFYEYRVRGE